MAISKVVVVDGNNLIVQIDRGVAGRGITDIQPIEIDNSLYLEFFFTDGTTETVGPVGTIQYIGQSPIVVNASTISLSTVPVTLGGTGQITANAGFNALAPSQTSNTGKYLKTDGTNTSWDLLDISTGDITGTLPVTNGGTGATTASGARTNLEAAASATTISAGTGLSGGGDLTANRTLSIANTGVTAAAYGSASKTLTATVNAQGQLTVLADTNIAITNTQVSGLGTASTQNAGVALGVATLDAGGTVPLSQIPASIQGGVSYQGSWNAATNTPTLTSSVGSKGYYYVVSVAGSTNLNGITTWNIGDWAIFNGTAWEKIDNTDAVTSVNGYTGTVVLTNTDITGFGTMSTQNANNVSITGGSVTGITDLAIADGGTGQSTAAAAITALTGTQVAGRYLRSDGTNAALSAIQAADVPTLNQNTSGTAAGLSATLAIASGGTGQITANAAFNALAPSQTGNSGKYLTTDGSNTSWATNPLGTVTSVDVSGGTTGLTTSGGPVTTSGTITLAGTLATTNGGTGLTSFTANGLVYASSTSALATSSALTFDGTNLGVGVTPTQTLNIKGIALFEGTAQGNVIIQKTGTSGFSLFSSAAGTLGFYDQNGGATRMILDSNGLEIKQSQLIGYSSYAGIGTNGLAVAGNVGIGTSSPAEKLEVYGSTVGGVVAKINNANASGYSQIYLTNSGASGRSYVLASGGNSSASGFANNFYIYDTAAAATRLTLDSAGNLGLGVTPSAWGGSYKAIQVNSTGAYVSNGSNATGLGHNYYYDGTNNKYLTTGAANLYLMINNEHRFYTAPSGTAGTNISFTQAMTLDASGNLLLGKTSQWSGEQFAISGSSSTQRFSYFRSTAAGHYLSLGTNGTLPYLEFGNGAGLAFNDGSTERARIDSSGNLLVGTTSSAFTQSGIVITPSLTRTNSSGIFIQHPSGASSGDSYVTFNYNAGTIGSITQAGTTGVLYNITSDYRLKENIVDAPEFGSVIDSIQVRSYDWKADGNHQRAGFIAQELVAVAPEAVHQPADPEQMMAVDYSKLVPMLVKEIQSLRQRLAALEAA